MPVTVVQNRTADLMKAVNQLVKSQVLVGIPDTAAGRQPEEGEPSPPSNAVIGYLQETGAPDQNLPARPFLVPGVQKIAEQIAPRMKKAGEAALKGEMAGVEAQLMAVGLLAQNSVRSEITEGNFAPLAERTLAARRARGRTGEKPLIDTSQMRNSVTFIVQARGV